MYSKEEEKKFTSEYVKLFSLGRDQIKKKKNFQKGLEIFTQCLDLATKINNPNVLCESNYYKGLCSFKLCDLKSCYYNFNCSYNLINSVDISNFPYYKIRGKVFAYLVHSNFLVKNIDENIQFIENNYENINKCKLEEKLVIFYNFIKELLHPIKKGNKFLQFKNEYNSSKNNVLFNNEDSISIKLKSIFSSLMNYQTMKLIFEKDSILYYTDTYNIPSNHLIFECFEKNDELINEKAKMKMLIESFARSNKIKLDKEFNTTSMKLYQERKDLYDKFAKIWELLLNSFQTIFKNNFNMSFSNSTKLSPRKRVATPSLNVKFDKNSTKTSNSTRNNRRISAFSLPSNTNLNEKKNNTEKKVNNIEKKISDKKYNNENIFYLESFKNDKNEINEIDLSRLVNSNKNIKDPDFLRNINPFLIKKILSEFEKEKEIRPCDIVNLKIPNYITSHYEISRKGNHSSSMMEDVNQDTLFFYKDFLLIKDLYYFGVCDGHGPSGHKVSEIAPILISSFLLYNEMDNNVSKRNKSIDYYLSSLFSVIDENKNVKEMDMIKYFYNKFQINLSDFSLIKNNFTELSQNIKESITNSQLELGKYRKKFDIDNSGSTICNLILKSSTLTCINIGDSRAIMISKSKEGKWTYSQLTKDHKPTEPDEKNRIIKSGGSIHKMRNYEEDNKEIGPYRVWLPDDTKGPGLAMSRSFGDFVSKEIGVSCHPDIFRFELTEYDKFLIVASDGVWEYMSNDDVLNLAIDKKNSQELCEDIVKESLNKWKERFKNNVDDISVVVVAVNVRKG